MPVSKTGQRSILDSSPKGTRCGSSSTMSNQPLSTIGIRMPQEFPTRPYEAVYRRLGNKRDSHPESFREFVSAWVTVAYRFLSCDEHNQAFSESVKRFGKTPLPLERYVQERELYGFFVAGFSVIESFCYGIFAIGSISKPKKFPFVTPVDKRKVSPEVTADKFGAVFKGESITTALHSMRRSQDFRDWKNIRNILSHRSTPGRHAFLGGDRNGEVIWGEKIPINENTTASRFRWLVDTLDDLLDTADEFTSVKLPWSTRQGL